MKLSGTDIIVICLILLTSLGGYTFAAGKSGGSKSAVIEVNGEVFGKYPMTETRVIDVKGKNTVEITKDYVRVIYADCPDKSDVNQGKISEEGQVIVCLPNKMLVRIENTNGNYDAVSS